jgi:hypothetical protein
MTYIKPTPSCQQGSKSGARMGRGDRRQVASGDGKWRNGHAATRSDTAGQGIFPEVLKGRPRQDSNLRTRLRSPFPGMALTSGNMLEEILSGRV